MAREVCGAGCRRHGLRLTSDKIAFRAAVDARFVRKALVIPKLLSPESRQAQAREGRTLRPQAHPTTKLSNGRVMRLEYADQGSRWTKRQRSVFRKGRFTIHGAVHFAQKYALPLLFGIFLAILLANTDEDFYQRWCGVSHHGNDDDHRRLSGDDDSVNHPTLFGLRLRGHDITLHFLVNDVLMAFFFGLAVKEICEAFQPGGSLYPPTRKAVNPIFGTLGGVIGPVALYFILLAIASAIGAVGLPFGTLATGWGIPTATDISVAWVVAYRAPRDRREFRSRGGGPRGGHRPEHGARPAAHPSGRASLRAEARHLAPSVASDHERAAQDLVGLEAPSEAPKAVAVAPAAPDAGSEAEPVLGGVD